MSTGAIGITRFEMERGQQFRRHVHDEHQLAWVSRGVLMVEVDDRYWVLPPSLALWVPAGTWHATIAVHEAVMEGVYVDPRAAADRWSEPTVVSMSPLARELLGYLAGSLGTAERGRAERVLLDVLDPVERATIDLPMPRDDRARAVAQLVLADPAGQGSLEALGREVGASSRTILRLFLAETGMTFAQWRAHARLQGAVAMLASGDSVSRVASRVGYTTSSAFVAAFRRVTGRTPGAYFSPKP